MCACASSTAAGWPWADLADEPELGTGSSADEALRAALAPLGPWLAAELTSRAGPGGPP